MSRAGSIVAGAVMLGFALGATAWGEQKETITRR